MDELFELFYKHGLQPFKIFPDTINLEQQFNSSDLSALLLLHHYNQLTMSEMAEHLGAPLSTVTSISKRLVRKGFIYREKSLKDRRIIVNCLTNDGKMIAEEVLQIIQQTLSKVEAVLTPNELQQFIQLSLKVAKALQGNDESTIIKNEKRVNSRNIEIE